MAQIKSYTDLEQSKKLAEILPLESADMCWYIDDNNIPTHTPDNGFYRQDKNHLPCWSLAALLELLPKRLQIEDNVCELSVYLYGLYYWNITNGNPCFESKYKDNLVDACYEMIIRLHELNLL